MQEIIKSKTLITGLAMFSMFFGAGNVIFPLALGHYAQDKTFFAIIGLLITAVAMPFAGLIAMILYNGDYMRFFGRIGKIPGFLVALLIMLLLGPLGSTPRCIALSYSTFKMSVFPVSPILFSAISCVLIFLFSYKKSRILDLLGYILTPLLLLSLLIIIIMGFMAAPDVQNISQSNLSIFLHGLKEGYNTMDLLAAFFFSSVILASLRRSAGADTGGILAQAIKSSLIGAVLLAGTYIGFSYIASFHGHSLDITGKDELLGAITLKIIGPSAGILVCITIALACLTTAIALSSVFAEFLQKTVFENRIGYETALIGSLIVTFFVSTYEFTGISNFLGPILQVCYPALIALTFLNIAHSLWGFKWVKTPVFAVFVLTLLNYFLI